MKKSVYLWMCVLVMAIAGLSACSSDDDLKTGVDSVHFYQDIRAPYIPIAYEDSPEWLKSIMDNSEKNHVNTTVIRGKKDGQYIYNVHNDLMSILIGMFYDQDGHQMNDIVDVESLIYETQEWTCIVYYKYY